MATKAKKKKAVKTATKTRKKRPAKKMKLSDAILKGIRMDGPQAFGEMIETDEKGNMKTCALGAAALTIPGALRMIDVEDFDWEAPVEDGQARPSKKTKQYSIDPEVEGNLSSYFDLPKSDMLCPEKDCGTDFYVNSDNNIYTSAVVHLNDDHHWKRERIAAWLKAHGA